MKKLALLCACLGVSHAFALEKFRITITNKSSHAIGLFQSANNRWNGTTGNIPLDPFNPLLGSIASTPITKIIVSGTYFSYDISDDHPNGQAGENHGLAFGIYHRLPRNDKYAFLGSTIFDVINPDPGAPYVDMGSHFNDTNHTFDSRVVGKVQKQHTLDITVNDKGIEYVLDNKKGDSVPLNNTDDLRSPYILGSMASLMQTYNVKDLIQDLNMYSNNLFVNNGNYNGSWDYIESENSITLGYDGTFKATTFNSEEVSVDYTDATGFPGKCEYINEAQNKLLATNLQVVEKQPVANRRLMLKSGSNVPNTQPDPEQKYVLDNTLSRVIGERLKGSLQQNPEGFTNELSDKFSKTDIPFEQFTFQPGSITYISGLNSNVTNAINDPSTAQVLSLEDAHQDCFSSDKLENKTAINQTLTTSSCDISVTNGTTAEYNSSDTNEEGGEVGIEYNFGIKNPTIGFSTTIHATGNYSHSTTQGSSHSFSDEKTVTYHINPQNINVPPYCKAVVSVSLKKATFGGRARFYATISPKTKFSIEPSYSSFTDKNAVKLNAAAGILPWSSSNSATTKTTPKLGATAPSANEQNVTPTLGTRLLQKLKAFNSKWLH